MPSLQAVRDSNSTYSPSYIPTIVVFGGTSGIGEAISKAFAKYTKGRAHLIIVGRNKAAAEATIASLPKASSDVDPAAKGSQYEFVSCDVTAMKNIHQLSEDLKARLEKINYLILSAGVFGFSGREDTVDGLDAKITARYYSRFAILQDFIPLLKAAKAKGEAASVLSVLGAGQTNAIDFDDLGLNKKYSGINAMVHSTTYNDLMVQVRALIDSLFLLVID
jgi:NAD(P)-dependent dehydrogenase (short-subunit alcohol dehydrogenase family)